MAKKKDSKVIGRCDCLTCGSRMGVLQNVRHALYTHCPECGSDQRNGAPIQTYLWFNTEWIDGEPNEKPRNLKEKDDIRETTQHATETKNNKRGLGWLLFPVGIVMTLALRR